MWLPLPLGWLVGWFLPNVWSWVWGTARFRVDTIGGGRVDRFRSDLDDPADAAEDHLFRSYTSALVLALKRWLQIVAHLLNRITRYGFTLSRRLEHRNRESCIVSGDPVGVVEWGLLVACLAAELDEFVSRVDDPIVRITDFVHQVVVHRREFAVRGWTSWVLEDPLVHLYRWLHPDPAPPAPFPQS